MPVCWQEERRRRRESPGPRRSRSLVRDLGSHEPYTKSESSPSTHVQPGRGSAIGYSDAVGVRNCYRTFWCNQDAARRPRCQTGASVRDAKPDRASARELEHILDAGNDGRMEGPSLVEHRVHILAYSPCFTLRPKEPRRLRVSSSVQIQISYTFRPAALAAETRAGNKGPKLEKQKAGSVSAPRLGITW